MDIFFVDPDCGCEIGSPPINHLAGSPHGHLIAVPSRDRGVGLHHRVGLVGGRVGLIQSQGCVLEGPLEVTDRCVGLLLLVRFDRAILGLRQGWRRQTDEKLAANQPCEARP